MAQAEAPGGKTFFIGSTDGAAFLYVGSVHVCRQRRDEWVEDVG